MRAVVILLVLGACSGAQAPQARISTPPPKPLPDPTHGICTPAPVEPASPAEATAAAATALAAGCPARAAALLEPALTGRALSIEADWDALLLAQEIRAAEVTRGYDDVAVASGGRDDHTLLAGVMAGRDPTRDQWDIAQAIRAGTVPREVVLGGRLGALITRLVDPGRCGGEDEPSPRPTVPISLFISLMTEEEQKRPEVTVMLARAGLFQCRLDESQVIYGLAAKRLREAGREAEAQRTELRALEVRLFPGGRAGDLGRGGETSPASYQRDARAELTGKRMASIVAIRAALDEWSSEHKPASPEVEARLAWLRGTAEIALARDVSATVPHLQRLTFLGVKHRRADWLDASHVLTLFTAVAAKEWKSADETIAILDRSFAQRGVTGARRQLVRQLLDRAYIDQALGVPQAPQVARLAGALAARLDPTSAADARLAVAGLLLGAGWFEEALAEVAAARTALEASAVADDPKRRRILAELGNLEVTLLQQLGRMDEAVDRLRRLEPVMPGSSRIADGFAAFLQGEHGPTDDEAEMVRASILVSHLACERAPALRILLAMNAKPTADAPLPERVSAAIARVQMARKLAVCGGILRDRSLVRWAREEITQAAPDKDDLSPALLDAAELEANGDHRGAARKYLEIARAQLARAALTATSVVGLSQRAEMFYRLAAAAALDGTEPDVELAVRALEESAARDLRASRSGAHGAAPDSPLARLEAELEAAQAELRQKSQLGGGDLRSLEDRVSTLAARHAALTRELAAANPARFAAAALAEPLALGEIQRRLASDEAMVYFHIVGERAWAIVIERQAAHAVRLPAGDAAKDAALDAAVRRLDHALRMRIEGSVRGLALVQRARVPRDDGGVTRAIAEVSTRLVAPLLSVLPSGRRVIVVPDPLLADVPFALLQAGNQPWIARNPLRVLPGAYLLPASRAPRAGRGEALVVGDPAFGPRLAGTGRSTASAAWTRLPHTRVEAERVAQLYGVRALLGANATEETVRARLERASIVHLATHGTADVVDPARSAVILSDPPARATGDGLLFAYEIEASKVTADLVVLSACETGRGQRRGAAGVLALDRAFLAAGAGAVVSSHWMVDDEATAVLMQRFHQELRAGRGPDVALARAQLAVRARWADPLYWAAFRVVGMGSR